MLVITCQALYSLGPGHLKDHLTLLVSAHLLQLPGEGFLCVPPLSEAQVVGTRAFSTVASELWNSLLAEAYQVPSLQAFQKGLNTIILRWAFISCVLVAGLFFLLFLMGRLFYGLGFLL